MKETAEIIYYPASARFPERAVRWDRVDYPEIEKIKQRYTVTVKYPLPPPFLSFPEKKIAFVSDLHYTGSEKCRLVLEEITEVLKREKCDMLLLGGDICADSSHLKYLPEVLERLSRCAVDCVAVPGNWERGKTWLGMEYWEKLYAHAGIRFLCNRSVCCNGVTVIGTDDCGRGYPELPEKFSGDRCNILLVHRPDTAVYLDRKKDHLENCDLVLCGHTHAGQIRFIRGILPASKYGMKFDYGFFRHRYHDMLMYVSGGAGELSFPFRFNCPREIVIFANS